MSTYVSFIFYFFILSCCGSFHLPFLLTFPAFLSPPSSPPLDMAKREAEVVRVERTEAQDGEVGEIETGLAGAAQRAAAAASLCPGPWRGQELLAQSLLTTAGWR